MPQKFASETTWKKSDGKAAKQTFINGLGRLDLKHFYAPQTL